MSEEHLTGQFAAFRVMLSGVKEKFDFLEYDLDKTKLDFNDFKIAVYED
jgi:hypothetical protein